MNMQQLQEIVSARKSDDFPIKLIAIDGHGGAGKSTLAKELAHILDAEVIHTDDFGSSEDLVDHWQRLYDSVLSPIKNGAHALSYARKRWGPNHSPEPVKDQHVTETMIIEGVGSSRRELRPYLSYAIWVETPKEVCIARGVERDGEAARNEWEKWWAQELLYISEHNPKDYANLIIDGTDVLNGL